MNNAQSRPFRFFDLPAELRLMVYERLPNRTIRTRYVKRSSDGTPESSFTLITYTAPTAVLATCETVNNEAAAILDKTAQQLLPGGVGKQAPFIDGTGPRIETDVSALPIIGAPNGPIKAAMDWCSYIPSSPNADFETFLTSRGYYVSFLSRKYGYMMAGGTFEEGVRRLLNFMCNSGCVLHIRFTNPSLSGPFPDFHIAITDRARHIDTTIMATGEFLSTLNLWMPAVNNRLNTPVRLHILDSAPV